MVQKLYNADLTTWAVLVTSWPGEEANIDRLSGVHAQEGSALEAVNRLATFDTQPEQCYIGNSTCDNEKGLSSLPDVSQMLQLPVSERKLFSKHCPHG